MSVRIYLLDLTDVMLPERLAEFLREAPLRVDVSRREKAEKIRSPQSRAASLGAGLLLQKMAADWQSGGCLRGMERYTAARLLAVLPPAGGCSPQEPRPGGLSAPPLPLQYRFGPHGKPELKDFPLHFSLSHSGEYVLCAVSEEQVGADIQRLQAADFRKLAGRFFTPEECKAIEACGGEAERQRLFFRLWTEKEACGKLTGQGVAAVLRKDVRQPGLKWHEIPAPDGYEAAVCTGTETD